MYSTRLFSSRARALSLSLSHQVGPLNGTNFAPSFLPDDSGIIFSSNMDDPR